MTKTIIDRSHSSQVHTQFGHWLPFWTCDVRQEVCACGCMFMRKCMYYVRVYVCVCVSACVCIYVCVCVRVLCHRITIMMHTITVLYGVDFRGSTLY